jgi:tRNA (guanosine-2'-O-)-methyltransferase
LGPADLTAPWPSSWTADQVVSTLSPMVLERRRERLEQVIGCRLASVTLLLDELQDPHNRAAVVRSCDAFGVQRLHALQPGSQFAVHHGVATGTERWVDVCSHRTPVAAIEHLRQRQFQLVATHPEGELTPEDLSGMERVAVILGNEHRGICPQLEQAAAARVRIPMRGFVESLNVSVSAALVLRAATSGRRGDLTPATRLHLFARALFLSVPRASEVLAALTPS